jgi:hypothetical protein
METKLNQAQTDGERLMDAVVERLTGDWQRQLQRGE